MKVLTQFKMASEVMNFLLFFPFSQAQLSTPQSHQLNYQRLLLLIASTNYNNRTVLADNQIQSERRNAINSINCIIFHPRSLNILLWRRRKTNPISWKAWCNLYRSVCSKIYFIRLITTSGWRKKKWCMYEGDWLKISWVHRFRGKLKKFKKIRMKINLNLLIFCHFLFECFSFLCFFVIQFLALFLLLFIIY